LESWPGRKPRKRAGITSILRYFLYGRFLSYDSHGATPSHPSAEVAVGRSRGADMQSVDGLRPNLHGKTMMTHGENGDH
jgi:hypothetical protein